MNTLNMFQDWYASQCDGDWEHCHGITISTLDNPGWTIDIDLDETSNFDLQIEPIFIERSEDDWLHVSMQGALLKLRCGPTNLIEALDYFLSLVSSKENGDE